MLAAAVRLPVGAVSFAGSCAFPGDHHRLFSDKGSLFLFAKSTRLTSPPELIRLLLDGHSAASRAVSGCSSRDCIPASITGNDRS